MTPKEKAEQLVNMFINVKSLKLSDYSKIYHPTAKQCALIEVDEIIKVLELVPNLPVEIPYDFWNEVKQEIENL